MQNSQLLLYQLGILRLLGRLIRYGVLTLG